MATELVLDSADQKYVLYSYQWPAGTTTLTYSFADLSIPADGDRDDLFGLKLSEGDRAIVREAIAAWEAVCGIDFVEVDDSASANIRIGWQPYGDSDGVGGSWGIATSWFVGGTTTEVGITFDPHEPWNDESFYDTALHEIGHAMGIDHSDVLNAVMSGLPATPYADQIGRDQLTPDDIAAARALYGSPLQATDGDDLITGTPYDDDLRGGKGDDTLVGNLGNDTLRGGSGNDILHGDEPVIDAIAGGDDSLRGGLGNDTLGGGPGDDYLNGHAGMDSLSGDAGDDLLLGGTGDDALLGGEGHDRLFGASGDDFLMGDAGNDTLIGQNGNDSLLGDTGNDRIFGGFGNDTLIGGKGVDWLNGGGGDDLIGGGAGDDVLTGFVGDDSLAGEEGNDRLRAGAGDDALVGGPGNDTLQGAGGNDTLNGGEGDDVLYGDAGADVFVFSTANEHDTIQGFSDGEDLIDLRAFGLTNGLDDVTTSTYQGGLLLDLSGHEGGTVLVKGTSPGNLDEADFLF